ncbi:GrdB-related putative oxidoreductase [Companilactobacillus sp. HBUAS56275]|uniref:Glycine/betaine/sarcosine/D-proline family reductase selenoprotein B n=1 Tax=Candidatus Companilactobacillus pullicola TaxID=2838523 RepID=A0A9D1ZQM3_9LACO|nr:glycine/betaine/sarcosine/D-proline family reductase selenoprotein B [Candidatus Companilactobacillus pullicola]
MKVIIFLDQIQSGLGGKEKADTELGGKKLAMGAADTIDKTLKKQDSSIMATFFCGTEYYEANKDIVQGKITRMCQKMQPDVVLVGPTYDYSAFAKMACEVGYAVESNSDIPVVAMVAQEKNADTIENYKDKLNIVKMPKKGGTGLSDSIDHGIELCSKKVKKEDITEFVNEYCF